MQMRSTDDLPGNLAAARNFVAEAAAAGAEWVALPESFAYLRREGNPFPCAQGLDGEIVRSLCERFKQFATQIHLLYPGEEIAAIHMQV